MLLVFKNYVFVFRFLQIHSVQFMLLIDDDYYWIVILSFVALYGFPSFSNAWIVKMFHIDKIDLVKNDSIYIHDTCIWIAWVFSRTLIPHSKENWTKFYTNEKFNRDSPSTERS